MRISITYRDIQKGVRSSSTECPIAQAFIRMGYPVVRVMCTTVRVGSGDTMRSAQVSKKAYKFIEDFDSKKPVKPFTTIMKFK